MSTEAMALTLLSESVDTRVLWALELNRKKPALPKCVQIHIFIKHSAKHSIHDGINQRATSLWPLIKSLANNPSP